jgi:RNA polymerase sigma factor (sigma-70 family)
MISAEVKSVMEHNDTELVSQSLTGSREAFGGIVEQYQSLICSLAYSATGSLTQSEDLAQETFVIAWKQLRQLREPKKLRSWLCSIARSVISRATRRQTREPAHGAEALDIAHETPSPDPLPFERAINREEEAILWRSLEQIPAVYREPLVLFYREQQSIASVAEKLELSEDAVKQRLSRGRKLLTEEVMAFVEGALAKTNPGQAFAFSVLSALPRLTVAAGSSAVGGTALKGSAAGKAAITMGVFAIVKGLLIKFLPAVAGGWMTAMKLPESQRERKFVCKAYALLWIGAILYPLGLFLCIHAGRGYWDAHPRMLTGVILSSTFGFVAVLGPYAFWLARTQIRIRKEEAKHSVNSPFISQSEPYEYRSPRTFLGLPLLHVRFNCVEAGKTLPAKGWIAIGNKAYGIIFALGAIAVGGVSSGALAVGLVALGGFGIGLLAWGGMAVGVAAMGGAAVGYIAFGGGAIGWLGASGGATLARHYALGGGAIAQHANDRAAQAFMHGNIFFRNEWTVFNILIVMSWLLPPALSLYFKRKRERKSQAAQPTQ